MYLECVCRNVEQGVSRDTTGTAGDFSGFYAEKPDAYFSGARADFVRRLPRDPSAAILEIGCGTGATGALALKDGRCGRYVGVELFEGAAAEARKVLTEVVTGNVETAAFDWQPASFDALILSEVLEHLIEPGRVLKEPFALRAPRRPRHGQFAERRRTGASSANSSPGVSTLPTRASSTGRICAGSRPIPSWTCSSRRASTSNGSGR